MAEKPDNNIEKQEVTRLEKAVHHTWYIRKKQKITGPFPAGQISQLLLVGRLKIDDEISHDKDEWLLVSDVPSLIPDVLKALDGEDGLERLAAARRWADERREERREDNAEIPSRQSNGRRQNESVIDVEYRSRRESIYRSFREKPKRAFLLLSTFIIIVIGLLWGSFNYSPLVLIDEPNCNELPRIGVNWRNCNKSQLIAVRRDISQSNLSSVILRDANLYASNFTQSRMDYSDLSNSNISEAIFQRANLKGANFKNTDSRGADFTSANLSYVDFTGALILDAKFKNADLSHAIWVNGKNCQQGSIGKCNY